MLDGDGIAGIGSREHLGGELGNGVHGPIVVVQPDVESAQLAKAFPGTSSEGCGRPTSVLGAKHGAQPRSADPERASLVAEEEAVTADDAGLAPLGHRKRGDAGARDDADARAA